MGRGGGRRLRRKERRGPEVKKVDASCWTATLRSIPLRNVLLVFVLVEQREEVAQRAGRDKVGRCANDPAGAALAALARVATGQLLNVRPRMDERQGATRRGGASKTSVEESKKKKATHAAGRVVDAGQIFNVGRGGAVGIDRECLKASQDGSVARAAANVAVESKLNLRRAWQGQR